MAMFGTRGGVSLDCGMFGTRGGPAAECGGFGSRGGPRNEPAKDGDAGRKEAPAPTTQVPATAPPQLAV